MFTKTKKHYHSVTEFKRVLDYKKIKEMYHKGYGGKEIAKYLNVSPAGISCALERMNIKRTGLHGIQPNFQLPNKHVLIYFAGIFDGEGCIDIDKRRRGGNMSIRMFVSNTDHNLMFWIKKYFRGYFKWQISKKQNRKDLGTWCLGNIWEIKIILEKLLPYLIVKKAKAKEALKIIKSQWGI